MSRRLRLLFATIACCAFSAPASAEPDWNLQLGVAVLDFGYKEFDDDDRILNREDGVLPGLVLGLVEDGERRYQRLWLSYHGGDVVYDGQTQSGIPVRSRTDEDIVDLSWRIGLRARTALGLERAVYGGLGYRWWRRDIRSTQTSTGLAVAGLLETYRWPYLLLGTDWELVRTTGGELRIDLTLTRSLSPRMDVDFQGFGGYDDITLKIGAKYGGRLAFSWLQAMGPAGGFGVEPYVEYWALGRGPAERLTVAGQPTPYVAYEPRSETLNYGLNLFYRVPF